MRKDIFFIFWVSALLKMAQGYFHLYLIFPDEHFQALEPANWVVNGYGHRSWEWFYGARTWILPGLYMPVLWLMKQLGDVGSPIVLGLCRAYTGFFSALMPVLLYVLMRWRNFHRLTALWGAFAFSLWPTALVLSTATFSETWMTTGVFGVLLALIYLRDHPQFMLEVGPLRLNHTKFAAFAGLTAGLLFGLRFQSLAWTAPLCLTWMIATKPSRSTVVHALCGGVAGLMLIGVLDWTTWGRPFHTLWVYYDVNFRQQLLKNSGELPWWGYGPMFYESSGLLITALLVAASIVPFLQIKKLNALDSLVMIPALSFAIFHMLIGHKEFRYISPVFPALIYWSMLGVDVVLRYIQRIDKTPRSLSSSGYLLLGVLTVLSFLESNDPKRYFPADTTPLQVRMREVLDLDETKETKQEDCVVMDGIDWTWTRFDLLLGRSIPRHIYFYTHQKDASYDARVKTCRFAIVAYDRIREFQTLTSHAFQLQAKTRRGDVLLVRSLQGPRNL